MPAQEQLFLAAQQQQQRSANAGVRAPAAAPSGALAVGTTGAQGAPAPGSGPTPPHPSPNVGVGQTNVLSPTGHGARVTTPTSTSSSDNNIGGNDGGTSHPDVGSPSTAATAPSSLSAAAPGESQQRLSPASLQKQSDDDSHKLKHHPSPSQTLLSHSSKMADQNHDASPPSSSSSSSMLVDQVSKHHSRELPPSSDPEETDDCSQSSNSSESSNDSSEEGGGGGLPPQPVQQAVAAANKVDPATLLLPSVEALADTETLILFDWDDTLLASTHLANSNYRLDEPDVLPETVTQQLSLLEDAVIDMLDLAAGLGTVCIITNAETGWVELSCKKFLPRVMAHVEGLPVVSARSTYEPKHPALPSKWKLEAFSHRIGQLCNETAHSKAKNVISLGDSHAEREAVRTVTRGIPCMVTKSVKFVERPTIEQLLRELQLMVRCFPMICYTQRDLDLALTVEALQVAA